MDSKKMGKRMSLNPKNKSQYSILQKAHATELEVSSGVVQESQSTISNQQQYSPEDLERIFTTISEGKEILNVRDLYSILQEEGYNECLYSAVEMIALVDQQRKGFVTKKEFFQFFSNKNYVDEERTPQLSKEMIQNRKWVRAIDDNWEQMKEFADKDYCNYVSDKIRKFKSQSQA